MEFRSWVKIRGSTLDGGHDTFLGPKKVLELEIAIKMTLYDLGMTF